LGQLQFGILQNPFNSVNYGVDLIIILKLITICDMKKFRIITSLTILIITLLGFASKFYAGPAVKWVNNSLGGLLYEVFWCLVISLILIKNKPWKIAFSVFFITGILEFLQLWHPVFLEIIRNTFIGRTIFGTTFVPSDFIYYIFGSLVGWILLEKLRVLQISNGHNSNSNK